MKKGILIVCVVALVSCAISEGGVTQYNSRAAYIAAEGTPDYEIDFETLADGTPIVGEQYISGNEWASFGVQFSPVPAGTTLKLMEDTDGSWTNPSPTHGLRQDPWDDGSVRFNFSVPIPALAFTYCDNEQTSAQESISLFDASGGLIQSYPLPVHPTGTGGPEANYFVGYGSTVPIASVLIQEDLDGDGVAIDDVLISSPNIPFNPPVISDFEQGHLEGWTVEGDGDMSIVASEGNPGGYARVDDKPASPNVNSWAYAPEKFLGDWSGLVGETLSVDAKQIFGSLVLGHPVIFEISGPGGYAVGDTGVPLNFS